MAGIDPQTFTRMEMKSPADGTWVEVDSLRTHVIGFNDKTWLRIGFRHRSTEYDELLNYETVLSGAFWSKGRFVATGADLACTSTILGFAISGRKDVKSAWISAIVKKIKYKDSDRDWLCEVVWQMEKSQHKDFGSPVNIWLSVNRREIRIPGKEMPLDHPIIARWIHCMAEVMSEEEHMSLSHQGEEKQEELNVQPAKQSQTPRDDEFTIVTPRRSSRQKAMKKVSTKEDDGRNPPPGTSDENEGDVANMPALHSPQESGSSKDPDTEMLLLLCDAAAVVNDSGKGGTRTKNASSKKNSTSKTTPRKYVRDEPKPTPGDVSSRKRKQEASSNLGRHKCPSCASVPGPLHPPPEFMSFARELGPNRDEVVVGPPCQHHSFLRARFRRPDVFPPPPMIPLPHMAYMPSPAPLTPPPPGGMQRVWPPIHFRPSHPVPVHIAPCTPYNWCLPPSHHPHPGAPITGVRIRHCQPRTSPQLQQRGNELRIVSAQPKPPNGNQGNAPEDLPETEGRFL